MAENFIQNIPDYTRVDGSAVVSHSEASGHLPLALTHADTYVEPAENQPQASAETDLLATLESGSMPPMTTANFANVFAELQPQLISYVTWLVGGDTHTAADLLQDAMLQAWRALSEKDLTIAKPSGWLYRIITTTVLDWRRHEEVVRRHGMYTLDSQAADGAPIAEILASPEDLEHYADQEDGAERAAEVLKQLSPLYALYLQLASEGYKPREIAQHYNVSAHSVNIAMYRARQAARAVIQELDTEAP